MARSEFQGTARFELLECLGRGGMGVVYSARDSETNDAVALKLLDTQAPEGLTRFKTEFRSVQAIRHHNLVALGELVEVDGNWFYTMELIDGVDLHTAVTYGRVEVDRGRDTLVSRTHRFNEQRLRTVLPQLVAGLDELHRNGKVHRDIKPSNILVTIDDRAVLLDFGMVFDSKGGERVTGTDVVLGTGAYMAPEQARSHYGEPQPAADWYALGVLLYEILAGRLPFDGSVLEVLMRKQREDVVPPQLLNPAVPDDLDELCMRLLQRVPNQRAGASEVRTLLGVVDPSASVTASQPASDVSLFVGRQQEIDDIVHLATTHYGPVTVIVQGESGMGKSSTVEQILARIRADVPDAVILLSRCYERESVPFRGVDNVMDGLASWLREAPADVVGKVLPEQVELLTHAFPSLGRVPAIRQLRPVDISSLSQHERRTRVFSTLSRLLSNLSFHAQIVIHIDDMQWAGADTWAVLESLMRSPRRPQVSLLLGRRPPSITHDPATVLPDVRLFELDVLPVEQAEELATRVLQVYGGDRSLAPLVAADTRGHPMFVHQLARYLAVHGVSDQPALLEDVLRAELVELSANAQAALDVMCLAAVPLYQRTIALASGVSTQKLIGSVIAELREAGLIRGGGARPIDRAVFFHDRIREVVVEAIDARRVARLHGRLADALEDSGEAEATPDILIRHLLAAGHTERAAQGAVDAAVLATKRLAFGQAVSLFEMALSLDVFEGAALALLQEQLAEALVNAGRGAQAADIFLALADSASRLDELRFRRRAAEQLLFAGHLERGLDTVTSVLAAVGEQLPSTAGGVMLRLAKERALVRLGSMRWRDVDPSDVTASKRELLELYGAISVGLSLVDSVRAAVYMARHLRLALRVGDHEQAVRALAVEATYCATQNNARRARSIAARVAKMVEHSDSPFARAYACFASGSVHFFIDANFVETLRIMDAAELHLREGAQATSWESDTARTYQCFCLMYRGELLELSERLERYLREAESRGSKYGSITLRSRVVVPALAAGRAAEIRSELEAAIEDWAPWTERYLVQHYYALHSRCEIALYTNTPQTGRAMFAAQYKGLKQTMLLRVPIVAAEVAFMRGRLAVAAAAAAQGAERNQLSREAQGYARALHRSKSPGARPWAGLLDAGIARVLGDEDAAVSKLEYAIAELDRTQNLWYSMLGRAVLGHAVAGSAGGKLLEEARGWALQNGIVNLDQFCRLALPGWHQT